MNIFGIKYFKGINNMDFLQEDGGSYNEGKR